MADKQKTQMFNGKKVTIAQNPSNQLWYILEVDKPKTNSGIIGLRDDDGFTGDGFKTQDDAQHWLDNAVPVKDEPTASVGGKRSASGASGNNN